MKILRAINAILYVVAIIFGILDLTTCNPTFKVIWTIFLGVASLLLLIVSIVQLKKQKKNKEKNLKWFKRIEKGEEKNISDIDNFD